MREVKPIEELFALLVELSGEVERRQFLDEQCGRDNAMRERLVRLLDSHRDAGSFLLDDTRDLPTPNSTVGQIIGPYKLREQIGEGGMGAVYVAEQEKPLRRKVALKLIKPGMDSKAVLGRFEAERNALALMNHPNIAKVLDAGQTDQGHPYFVMELVNGIPITEYCDQQKMTVSERLSLFVDVCQAIQHAHQKGIIHRDIKPSNVLVTELDGKPVAKVIDFGVAKALNQTLTEHSVYTAFQTVIGTPRYMSPEQASFSAVDVDTRSDVYSLGVLLYELLTGTTPFTEEDLRQAAQDEVFRFIRESEPPRPSNRISSLGETASRVSQHRRTEPEQLGRIVKGDLDWIVMKALAKERSRRYKTADAIGEDVGRFLEDRPVEARPDSAVYRSVRFYRRNRAMVWSVSLVLVLTWVASAVMYQQRAEALALLEKNRELVIQDALREAFEGDLGEVDRILEANLAVLDSEWQITLRGTAHWHAGHYKSAQELLKPLVESPSQSGIPVLAMLSVSYMYDGQWDLGLIYANQLRGRMPRDNEYRDLDSLFLAYALVFVDTERANELLEAVLSRNPSWLICHALLADASIHRGNFQGEDRYIESAFRRANALRELTHDNPFVLNVSLFAHRAMIERRQLRGEEYQDLVDTSEELVEELSNFPDFILSHAMPAQYYDVIGEHTLARNHWCEVLSRGGPLWQWAAAGRLLRDQPSEEAMKEVDELTAGKESSWLSAARAYVLTDTPGGREEALRIFDRITGENSTMTDRWNAVQILLLLGDKAQAREESKRWLDEYNNGMFEGRDTSSEWNEQALLRLVATDGRELPTRRDRLTTLNTEHMLGLMAIADGDRHKAREHFERAAAKPWVNIDYNWSEAFARKINENDAWPIENDKRAETHISGETP